MKDEILVCDDGRLPLDMLINDLVKNLESQVLYMAIAEVGSEQYNLQSCDCDEVVIVMSDRILLAKHEKFGEEGTVVFDVLSDFNKEKYNLRINPPADGLFEFKKVLYFEDGSIDCIKYRFGDRFLFIFSTWSNLVVTKSLIDLSGDEDTPIPERDRSVLFENERK